jgi:hypothetical protein
VHDKYSLIAKTLFLHTKVATTIIGSSHVKSRRCCTR